LQAGSAASVAVQTNGPGWLNLWVDFDGDGTWTDSEHVVAATYLSAGTDTLVFTVPAGAQTGATWARLRLTDHPGEVFPTGAVSGGEVEDYPVTISASEASVAGTVWHDVNHNGLQDKG